MTVCYKIKFTEIQLLQLLLHGKTKWKCGKQLSKLNENKQQKLNIQTINPLGCKSQSQNQAENQGSRSSIFKEKTPPSAMKNSKSDNKNECA